MNLSKNRMNHSIASHIKPFAEINVVQNIHISEKLQKMYVLLLISKAARDEFVKKQNESLNHKSY